jgi:AraC-like DNA-binding protein
MNSKPPQARVSHRRDGFPGQHLVVLPSPQAALLGEDPLLRDLFPVAAGRFPRAAGHIVRRRSGIKDYILIHVLEGRGWVGERPRRPLHAGQFFLIPPETPHAYGADDTDPWAVQWVHFRGISASEFARIFRPESPDGPISVHPETAEGVDFSEIYLPLEQGFTRRNLLTAAAHLRLLLTRLHQASLNAARPGNRAAVWRSVTWMERNLREKASLTDLAKAAGFSVPHYSALFRHATGFSPMEHFLRLKIQRACQLLDTTTLRVGEIANSLGWQDAYYFSRYFRRIIGKSPRAYRSVTKG